MTAPLQNAPPTLFDAVEAAAGAILAQRLDYETALLAAVGTLSLLEPDPDHRLAAAVAIIETLTGAVIEAAARNTDAVAIEAALVRGRFDPWIGRSRRHALLKRVGAVSRRRSKEIAHAKRC